MLRIFIKAYCINIVVSSKPIYLNKHHLFKCKIYLSCLVFFVCLLINNYKEKLYTEETFAGSVCCW